MVYSPLDALKLARENPDREVVFFAVGFETTAPGNAMAVWQAHQLGLRNFSILNSHVRVPPAIEAIMSSPESRVDAFLAAGHVCAVMGYWEYEPLADRYAIPIVVTGFEPLDLLQGIYMATKALAEGRHEVENQYARVVTRATATSPHSGCWSKCSRSATRRGAASARSRRAGSACARSWPPMTRRSASTWAAS